MIDDGLHTYEANAGFLANSLQKLSPGGVYIVEDILTENVERLHAFAAGFVYGKKEFTVRLVSLLHPTNCRNNNLLVVKRKEATLL